MGTPGAGLFDAAHGRGSRGRKATVPVQCVTVPAVGAQARWEAGDCGGRGAHGRSKVKRKGGGKHVSMWDTSFCKP